MRHVLPGLSVPTAPLDQLIDVRDGVVHAGFLSANESRESLTAYLRYCNALYEELGVATDKRWGDRADLVESLISQSLSEVEHEVQRKMAAAKGRYAALMAQIPKDEQGTVSAARQHMAPVYIFSSEERAETVQCPACNDQEATCIGTTDIDFDVDAEPGDSPGESIFHAYAVRIFYGQRFVCGACELSLSNQDELKAAGIGSSWSLGEVVDPSEYADDDHRDDS